MTQISRPEVLATVEDIIAEANNHEGRCTDEYAQRIIALVRAAAWQEFEAAMLEAAGERTIEMKVTIPAFPKNIVSNRSAELRPFVAELLAAIAKKRDGDE